MHNLSESQLEEKITKLETAVDASGNWSTKVMKANIDLASAEDGVDTSGFRKRIDAITPVLLKLEAASRTNHLEAKVLNGDATKWDLLSAQYYMHEAEVAGVDVANFRDRIEADARNILN